jgi:hypothetical protein
MNGYRLQSAAEAIHYQEALLVRVRSTDTGYWILVVKLLPGREGDGRERAGKEKVNTGTCTEHHL